MDSQYDQHGSEEEEQVQRTDGEAPLKKRRRTVKPNSDKKFECKFEGCGKSYSRAEHLYRHQLNHTPKNIYRCDYPDCNRYFVRQDLCIRHRERHTTHGSQLHKRDTFAQSTSQQNASTGPNQDGVQVHDGYTAMPGTRNSLSPSNQSLRSATAYNIDGSQYNGSHNQHTGIPSTGVSPSTVATDARFQPPTPRGMMGRPDLPLRRTESMGDHPLSPDPKQNLDSWSVGHRRQSFNSIDGQNIQARPTNMTRYNSGSTITPQSPARTYSGSTVTQSASYQDGRTHSDGLIPRHSASNEYLNAANLNSGFASSIYPQSGLSRSQDGMYTTTMTQAFQPSRPEMFHYNSMNVVPSVDMNAAYGYPLFGGDDFNQTPYAVPEDFTNWLFNDNQPSATAFSPSHLIMGYGDPLMSQIQGPYFSQSPSSSINFNPNAGAQQAMSVTSLMDSPEGSQYVMSEEKRQELLELMRNGFVERPHDAVTKRKESIFEGDIESDNHILSMSMMHSYMQSYWYHQHAQLPILHKPTFIVDTTPNLLLLAVIAIGAATLDKAFGTALTNSAAEFANFIAWHIRWEIVRDADCRPPAKLWVFQTLLLIEIYEKMYATRALHERAHIHHDSTLTLMRRGSSLLDRSSADLLSNSNITEKGTKTGASSISEVNKSEESWTRWITAEATRRAAFAAFVLDSIHATMFGHAAQMVAHEMRLPLPCDEGLWSATSPAEVGRVQSSLQINGVKPTLFLDGLKKTLNGQKVRTNSFGRTILMAGLLSVSWHMTQRDLQVTSLGPRTAHSFGGPDKWKGVLLRAFDNWKRDFDEALAESTPPPSSPPRAGQRSNGHAFLRPVDNENIFESRTVLHHLAHIAAHVDVVDCQVYAGANRLLGRSITPKDYSSIREKIEKWATKASARDAAFYALKFLVQVLTPPDEVEGAQGRRYDPASPILPQAFEQNQYIARDDFLINRPWVLYISALVVWCYGFALEGPITPRPREEDFDTYEKRENDMHDYLDRVAGIRAPDDLENVKDKNRCLGLLMILKESFASTRWELTHEAAKLLGNCCTKLTGLDEIQPQSRTAVSANMSRTSMKTHCLLTKAQQQQML